ncbi:MAG: hypothetical protein MJE77_34855 [Proteobacteria bacterium]|nr:hypothetical protein [Pseudomonadota bacterium]
MVLRRYSKPFRWHLGSVEPGQPLDIELYGCLDESADFDPLVAEIAGPARLDACGLERVNSLGAGKWFRFMQAINHRGPHCVVKCSPALVRVLGMLPALVRLVRVDSVMAAFVCLQCESERSLEVSLHSEKLDLPQPRCSQCGSGMRFDENPDSYFRFLRFRT